jgi:hypothetical protein
VGWLATKPQILLVAVLFLAAPPSSAQNFIGPELKIADGAGPGILVNGWFEKTRPIGGSERAVGFHIYGLADQSPWAQFYGGLSFYPARWLGFSAGAGMETDDNPWRAAASVAAFGRGHRALLLIEHGGSGFWYRAQYARSVASRLELGVFSRRYSPTGPYVALTLGKHAVWATAGPNLEDGTAMAVVGVNVGLP